MPPSSLNWLNHNVSDLWAGRRLYCLREETVLAFHKRGILASGHWENHSVTPPQLASPGGIVPRGEKLNAGGGGGHLETKRCGEGTKGGVRNTCLQLGTE